MGLGPVYAMSQAAEKTGLNPADADIIEINEAFAAQTARRHQESRLNLCQIHPGKFPSKN